VDRLALVAALVTAIAVVAVLARRRRPAPSTYPATVDAMRLGLDPSHGDVAVVAFSGPLCHACQQWSTELETAGIPFRKIDVLQEAALARDYGVSSTPIVLVVDRADGRVLSGFDHAPDDESVARVRSLTTV
jgi:hypothetical protein